MYFSIRYKIQLAVLTVLALVLTVYISLVSREFEKSKISDLYELTLLGHEALASRMAKTLTTNLANLNLNLNQSDVWSRTKLPEIPGLQGLIIRETKNQKITRIPEAIDPPDLPKIEGRKDFEVVLGNPSNSLWIYQKTELYEIFSHWNDTFFADDGSRFPEAFIALIEPLSSRTFLISSADLNSSSEINTISVPAGGGFKVSEINWGAKTLVAASDNFQRNELKLIFGYPKDIALQPVQELKMKSLYFSILVFGVTGLLALWIGNILTRKLKSLTSQTKLLSEGTFDLKDIVKSHDEVGILSLAMVKMAQSLKIYIGQMTEKSRMESELKTARLVQETLFPKAGLKISGYELQGFYESSTECGGDFWYYWSSGEKLFFMICDATGHGAPAALITSAARAVVSACSTLNIDQLSEIVRIIDNAVRDSSEGRMQMTGFIGELDLKNGKICYYNLSHEPGIKFKKGFSIEQIEIIGDPISPRLGDARTNTDFQMGTCNLEVGETLFLYTDGLSEIENSQGKRRSERTFYKDILKEFESKNSLKDSVLNISESAKTFSGIHLNDDLTILAIQRYA